MALDTSRCSYVACFYTRNVFVKNLPNRPPNEAISDTRAIPRLRPNFSNYVPIASTFNFEVRERGWFKKSRAFVWYLILVVSLDEDCTVMTVNSKTREKWTKIYYCQCLESFNLALQLLIYVKNAFLLKLARTRRTGWRNRTNKWLVNCVFC